MRKDYPDVVVIDSIMGSGKTSWAIQYINEHPEKSFIYCTPFLDEVTRIKQATNRTFYEPQYKGGGRKIDDFNSLLMEGQDIVLTHATFANSNADTLDYLQKGNYILILDEVLDVLVKFNDVCGDSIGKGDIKMLLKERFIHVDEYGKVSWVKDSYADSKYGNVERIAKNGHLFYLDDSLLVWQFPPEIFRQFESIYLLTYLFDGSMLKPYFQYHEIHYELSGIFKESTGYRLIEWNSDKSARQDYKKYIEIWDNPLANEYKATTLSKTWYLRQREESLKKLRSYMYNFFQNVARAKSKDILWTAPKDFRKHLKGKGYSVVRNMTAEERMLPANEREAVEKKLQCFLPCNARATNDYADRTVLAYLINLYANPFVKRYFMNKNKKDGTNIAVNEDMLALGCMLQWIWRSGIRKPEPAHIKVYIPSKRMRKLLTDWLDGNI